MTTSSFKKSSIARLFILYIVIFSSFITVIITAFQLYRDYHEDLDIIQNELNQIKTVHLVSLTSALWAANSKLLQTSLEGILEIRDIQFVEIRDGEKIWATIGEIKGEDNLQQIYPMEYLHRDKNINIGSLMVNVSLNGVYQRLYDKVWVILISNGIKTSLVAVFIYFLFYQLVARHLTTISNFSKEHDPLSNNSSLSLERRNRQHDEFDVVVNSINDMHARLHEQISEAHYQKQYLSQTLNSIGDAVITTDNEGCVTRLNPVAEQLTGWSNDEAEMLPLKTIFKIVNASTREPIENPVDKVLATGETVYLSNHTTLIAKDNKEYQIADSAAPIRDGKHILGMVLVFNDVTEQYRLREELQSKEREQREILQSMVDAIITIDEKGMVTSFNHSAERLFGYSVSEIIGKNVNCLMPEPFHNDHNQYLQNHITSGKVNIIGLGREVIGLRKNKKTFPMRLYVEALPPAADGKQRFIGSCTDLTQIKDHEEQLRRSQKMDALGKLTGGIAHDYNNMLGVMLGYAELLADEVGDNQPVLLNYINEITHAGERGAKLTKKLLTFSRNKSSDTKKVNVNTLLYEQQNMLEKTLTARIQLELKLDKDLWLVCLDDSEFEDAILNLSINAMHAIEGNGTLTIKTDNKKIIAGDAERLNLHPGDYIRLSISDTGCGMDNVTRGKVFDPFYTTKGEKGTGLGLSQVYGFINRSAGTIEVDSKLEQGSRFTLYIPRYLGEDDSQHQLEDKTNSDLKGKETILVVDDEPALLNLMCKILSLQGYQIFTAEHAKQALEIMQKEHIDILISDIIMPEMDGYALAAIVQKEYPDIKIQLVSGYSGEHHADHVDNILTQNLLNKPYKAQTLLKNIRALLE